MAVTFFHTVKSFTQFLWNWKVSGGGLVDQNTANIRGEICASCHNNKPSSEVKGGCGACRKMGDVVVQSVRSSIIDKHTTTADDRLLTCGVCGCDLKISVWIPNKVLLHHHDANAYPDHCWKKFILLDRDL